MSSPDITPRAEEIFDESPAEQAERLVDELEAHMAGRTASNVNQLDALTLELQLKHERRLKLVYRAMTTQLLAMLHEEREKAKRR